MPSLQILARVERAFFLYRHVMEPRIPRTYSVIQRYRLARKGSGLAEQSSYVCISLDSADMQTLPCVQVWVGYLCYPLSGSQDFE
jgi:hypothetical protein